MKILVSLIMAERAAQRSMLLEPLKIVEHVAIVGLCNLQLFHPVAIKDKNYINICQSRQPACSLNIGKLCSWVKSTKISVSGKTCDFSGELFLISAMWIA